MGLATNHTDNPIINGVTIYKTDSSSLPNELRNRESLYDLETIKNETAGLQMGVAPVMTGGEG